MSWSTSRGVKLPLVLWTLVAGGLFAAAMLVLMEIVQTSTIRQVAEQEFAKRVREAAFTDRQRFDEAMRGHKHLVRILAEQDKVRAHALEKIDWSNGPALARTEANSSAPVGLPAWLESRTIFHALPTPDFIVFMDEEGVVRDVYRLRDLPVPRALVALSARDIAVTRGQSLLKSLDGAPYILSSWPVSSSTQVIANLMVASRIDDYFLSHKLRLALEPSSVLVLLAGNPVGSAPTRVVSSNAPDRVETGSQLADLSEEYLLAGDEFPHYGVAESPVRFATLVPRVSLREMVDPVVKSERRHRILLSAILIAFFLLLLTYLSLRIRRLNSAVAEFSRDALGAAPADPRGTDELGRLRWQFEHLADEIFSAREALLKESTERLRLTAEQMAVKAENERLKLLQTVTATMDVGVLKVSADGPVALNSIMRDFAKLCGGLSPFAQSHALSEDIEIRDIHGCPRIFSVTAPAEMDQGLFLVEDVTELRRHRETIERTAAEETVLGNLLRLSHQPTQTKDFLKQALAELLSSVPWLKLEPQGAVFLCDGDRNSTVLTYKVSHNMYAELKALCERVPFGRCHCGRAASTRKVQFANCVDERHETRFPGMPAHGHYSVPILSGEAVLGVMVLYVREGHRRMAHEEAFLTRIADVLSMGITSRRADAILEHRAYHDSLTGLPNRRALLDRLQHEIDAAVRGGYHGAVLFLDLDHFKTLNDSMGHPSGDTLLRQVAGRLTHELRAADTVARLGGDEFVVLLSQLNAAVDHATFEVQSVAEKIRTALAQPYDIDGHAYHSTPSIGVVLFPTGGESADDILKHADTAMYRAKADGRDRARFYLPSMQAAADARLALEKDLRLGIERGEFVLWYQPQVLVDSGQLIGAEALLRWQHPERGLLSPGAFIKVAEETGLIAPLGEWVLRTALRQFREWSNKASNFCLDAMSVNISPRQFQQLGIVDEVSRLLRETAVHGSHLILEITESVMMSDIEAVIEKMRGLRDLKVRFSIDDFGTGYSSLSYLKRLPISQLKIDRSFLEDLPESPNDSSIIDTIIATARHLGMEVIAEGVETAGQLEALRSRGCRKYQGRYFSNPLAARELAHLLRFGRKNSRSNPALDKLHDLAD
jgi:diguanylate cyclase (GGDEF)-like protein